MEEYIHGDSLQEQERLSKLNAMTNASFIPYLGLSIGLQICDFGWIDQFLQNK
jgi:hypothetical protein